MKNASVATFQHRVRLTDRGQLGRKSLSCRVEGVVKIACQRATAVVAKNVKPGPQAAPGKRQESAECQYPAVLTEGLGALLEGAKA
jgi:hypothetical protein